MRDRRAPFALIAVLALELALFGAASTRFLSLDNALEIVRSTSELGLVALASTFVMTTGGIDLSVGSVIGLSGVALGELHDRGAPMIVAIAAALAVGALVGALNGAIVTRAKVPPLVVTLASMALVRGVAEGWTHGYTVYTGFPAPFLALGQGYLFGVVPWQLFALVAASCAAWFALHRAPFGRKLVAIGFSPEGARHAAIDVAREVRRTYWISGIAAAAAGVLYVAHLGQGKADAGSGYELSAITVVALGGTPIVGGRGTIGGTLLALFAIAVLQNGLLLVGEPTELASILLGVVLVAAVLLQRRGSESERTRTSNSPLEFDMKNSQVAVLVVAILLGAAIIAWSNARLVGSIAVSGATLAKSEAPKKTLVAMMPKNKSDPYFVSCRAGAEDAAREFGVDLVWDGPNDTDAARQNEVVEAWITRGVDVIAASVENAPAISTVLRKARAKGIRVLTWDADAEPDARDFFVNQATAQGIGYALTDEAARILGGAGKFAIVTASLTAANQNAWIEHIKARVAEKWPKLELAVVRPSDGLRDKALSETKNILRAYPDVKLIMTIAAAAVPGSAEAVKQEGSSVKVIGLSVPSLCRDYIHQGIIESIILWNTKDLGYLTVRAAKSLASGELKRGATKIDAGRLGAIEVKADNVLLGVPFKFDKSNVDQFEF